MPLAASDRTIYVRNTSTRLTAPQVQAMVAACDRQLRLDFAPVWGLDPTRVGVRAVTSGATLPKTAWMIVLADQADDPQALGYHDLTAAGVPAGVIQVPTILDNGGQPLTGAMSVSSVLSHEVLEVAADCWATGWADTGRGYVVAQEVADPVQGDSYAGGDGVAVSSFVAPQWFDPAAPAGGRFDWLGKLRKPFEMSKGGYLVRAKIGRPSQSFAAFLGRSGSSVARPEVVFGPEVPAWVRAARLAEHTRVGRRLRSRR